MLHQVHSLVRPRLAALALTAFAFATLAPAAFALQSDAVVDLAPNFNIPPEREAVYEHIIRIDTTQGASRIGEQGLRTQVFRRFSVVSAPLAGEQDDGAIAVASFLISRVAMRVDQRDKTVFDFDSDRPRALDPKTQNLSGQVNALRTLTEMEVFVRLGPKGEVIRVEGLEPIRQLAQEDQGASIILGFIGQHWFKGMCEQIWSVANGRSEVHPNEPWTRIEVPSVDTGQSTPLRTTFTLKNVEDRIAHITGVGGLDVAEDEPIQVMAGASAEVINHKSTAKVRWSLDKGRAIAYEHRFAMETALNLTGMDVIQIQDITQSLVEAG